MKEPSIEEMVDVILEEVQDCLYGMNINCDGKEYKRLLSEVKTSLLLQNKIKHALTQAKAQGAREERADSLEMFLAILKRVISVKTNARMVAAIEEDVRNRYVLLHTPPKDTTN